jgi:hypothetical protein
LEFIGTQDQGKPGALKLPYNPNAPPEWAPQSNALNRFAQGAWANTGAGVVNATKAVWDLMNVAGGDKKELDPETKAIAKNIVDAHRDQWQKAQDAWEHGSPVEAAGHTLATILPFLGPTAAHAAERAGGFTPPIYDKYGNVIQSGQAPDVAGGLGEAIGLLSPFALARVPGAVRAIAPSAKIAEAGTALESVSKAAGHLPIDVAGPGQAALDAERLASAGGTMPKVMSDFLERTSNPQKPPLTFSEARDFYSNASRLSSAEYSSLTPVMQRAVGDFRAALDASLTKTAGQVGMGDVYDQAMQQYRTAMQRQATIRELKGVAKGVVKEGIGVGAGSTIGSWLFDKLWGGDHKAQGGTILDRMPSREATLAALRYADGGAAPDQPPSIWQTLGGVLSAGEPGDAAGGLDGGSVGRAWAAAAHGKNVQQYGRPDRGAVARE